MSKGDKTAKYWKLSFPNGYKNVELFLIISTYFPTKIFPEKMCGISVPPFISTYLSSKIVYCFLPPFISTYLS